MGQSDIHDGADAVTIAAAAERLRSAYAIVDMFDEMITEEVMPKMQQIFMTDDFEGLKAACGKIGLALEHLGIKNDFQKIVIWNEDTRNILIDSYRACQIVKQNVHDDSELADAISFIQTCYYVILNATYKTDTDVPNAIENIIGICEKGIEALDTIGQTDEAECEQFYLNTGGQKIHARIPELKQAFERLMPKYNPDKQTEDTEFDPETSEIIFGTSNKMSDILFDTDKSEIE